MKTFATKQALSEWLSSIADYDVFVTVTFKQAILNDEGGLARLTEDECRKTLRILRDRVTKNVLGNARYRSGETMIFVPCLEQGHGIKRLHSHICIKRPSGISLDSFKSNFMSAVSTLDWVHKQIDFREASDSGAANSLRLIRYSLKEGLDAFVPEAASI